MTNDEPWRVPVAIRHSALPRVNTFPGVDARLMDLIEDGFVEVLPALGQRVEFIGQHIREHDVVT